MPRPIEDHPTTKRRRTTLRYWIAQDATVDLEFETAGKVTSDHLRRAAQMLITQAEMFDENSETPPA